MIASLDIWIDHGRLLYAAKALDKLKAENDDQRVGMEIVRKALVAPAKQIVVNAGADGSIVVGKLRDKGDPEWGYDAQTDQHVNMYKAGIIDPTKGVRTALQDAASVAGLIITTEAMVAERPKKESAGAPGGMGDMDYQGSRNSRRVRAAPWERPSCVGRPSRHQTW